LIRLLFLSANPVDTDRLLLSKEYNDINDSLRIIPYRDQFDLVHRPGISITDLQRIWMEYDPQILHFSGHGSDIDGLIFENQEGNSEYISPKHLSDLFKVLGKNIHLVFLNACYTFSQAEAISKHIDYVIGTMGSIGDNAARIFAKYFYQAIGFDKSVQDAFELAKIQLNLFNIPEDQIPILLTGNGVNASETFFTNIHSELPSFMSYEKENRLKDLDKDKDRKILTDTLDLKYKYGYSDINYTNQGKQIQMDILKLKDNYRKLLDGDLTINEFWNVLFPFVNEFLYGNDYKEYRENIGQVDIDSLNLLLINLRDKKQSYNNNKYIDNLQQARIDENLFVNVSKNIISKLEEI
jgi:hypothetical protein